MRKAITICLLQTDQSIDPSLAFRLIFSSRTMCSVNFLETVAIQRLCPPPNAYRSEWWFIFSCNGTHIKYPTPPTFIKMRSLSPLLSHQSNLLHSLHCVYTSDHTKWPQFNNHNLLHLSKSSKAYHPKKRMTNSAWHLNVSTIFNFSHLRPILQFLTLWFVSII